MATHRKTGYYPLPEIFPRASTIFVSGGYLGRRIGERLIEASSVYAKEPGLDKTHRT